MSDAPEIPGRAVLAAAVLPGTDDAEQAESLVELGRLARTLGIATAGQVTQKMRAPDRGAYLGAGKREELKALVGQVGAELVLVDHELSPSQARNLENEIGVPVLDRTGLILEIFHRHARSRAARAQVEIVRLQYMAPRLRERGKGADRQRGGIGGKGAGESALELDRRKIRDRVAELTAELGALESERRTQRSRRLTLPRVALIGYTNAGKSTLMHALTGGEVYIADKLFATLDTTVRALAPETRPRILVSDTVGFIKQLPHGLVASFKSTLDEALEADLLLHVVDASDRGFVRQLDVTVSVLAEIGAAELPRLLIFNKSDRLDNALDQSRELEQRFPGSLVISARRPQDVAQVRTAIVAFLTRDFVVAELHVRHDRAAVRAEIFACCDVLAEAYDEVGATLRVRADAKTLERVRALLR
jgi:GTP-binding protein HflX